MKISEMPTQADVKKTLLQDPAFRAEWERTALARAVAIAVARYRAEHQLSQRQLAEQLGWKQPAVARLEVGESTPAFATLCELAQKLDLELALTITPNGQTLPVLTAESDDATAVTATDLVDGPRIAFTARPVSVRSRVEGSVALREEEVTVRQEVSLTYEQGAGQGFGSGRVPLRH